MSYYVAAQSVSHVVITKRAICNDALFGVQPTLEPSIHTSHTCFSTEWKSETENWKTEFSIGFK